jgi:DivIVA domain-containing protein
VALERQSIEKKDFPIGRRGYDPEAVDAHLAQIAKEIDQLKTSSRRRTETLASAASEQVRAIVEAAESSAAEIQRQAESEAQEIRAEAAEEAQSTRQQASTQARDYVGRVSESTAGMLQRLDAMESELSALIESLRTGANRLNADLQLLESGMQDVKGSVEPRPRFEAEAGSGSGFTSPASSGTTGAGTADLGSATADLGASGAGHAEPPQPSSQAEPALDDELGEDIYAGDEELEARDGAATGDDETEGARLIALNMALNGTPREETERYLAENFSLDDPGQLLDEVYSSVES